MSPCIFKYCACGNKLANTDSGKCMYGLSLEHDIKEKLCPQADMAAFGARFESEKSIDDKKEAKRREREHALRQAKDAYEKQQKIKEQKRLRGEDTWMLPGVNERLDQLAQEHSGKKKKKKEKNSKKAKKEKKQKSKKLKLEKNDESADSSSDSKDEWIESTPVSQSHSTEKAWKIKKEQSDKEETPTATVRDEWMTLDFMSMKTTSVASLRAEKLKEKELEHEKVQAIEKADILSRELNPYWKDGGTGLPPEEGDATSVKKVVSVEDGGLSWLKKSYQRMMEQSEREKRSLDEIIAARYGSVEIFQSKMEQAEKQASLRYGKRNDDRRGSWRKSKYSDIETSRAGRREDRMDKVQRDAGERSSSISNDSSRYRCNVASPGRENITYSEDRSWCGDRESGKGKEESARRNYDARTANEGLDPKNRYERPSSFGSQKHTFLKPSEDEGVSYKSRNRDSEKQSSLLAHQGSLSREFRKPGYAIDDVSPCGRGHAKEVKGREGTNLKPHIEDKMPPVLGRTHKEEEHKPAGDNLKNIPDRMEPSPEREPSMSRHESSTESSQVLSEEEMNKLGAKLVKAELLGNMDLASKLKAQLEKARELRESHAQNPSAISTKKPDSVAKRLQEDNEVLLIRTDQSGRAWPVNVAEPAEPKAGRRKREMVSTHEGKERVRYFKDDDNQSLQDLVRKEKMSTAEDQSKLFMRMASKFMEKTDKEYYTLDDMFVSKTARKECSNKEEEREREQAISEHRKLATRMEKCPYCFDNPELPKHLIVAIGKKVYVCLPNYLSLTDGHCLIAPLQHYHAATLLDEDIWEEIQVFRKALVRMFESNGLDCVFLETNMDMKKCYHMVYECIPLPKEIGDMAPIYFKKAIMESDEEWSMNKKLIDLASRDVRKSVPKGLPYFSVDFGLQGGFAHIIEDQHKFPHYFGKEIIGGMLDLEPRVWRKAVRENFDDQRKKVLQFAQWWKPYDFTKAKD